MSASQVYSPQWTSPPGSTIRNLVEIKDLCVDDLALGLCLSNQQMQKLLQGDVLITNEIAKGLSSLLGGSVDFWLDRDALYREDLVRLQQEEERRTLISWAKGFPLKDMRDRGWLDKRKADVEALLDFFYIDSFEAWKRLSYEKYQASAFRQPQNYIENKDATLAWIRQGEKRANELKCSEWNKDKLRGYIPFLRELSLESDSSVYLKKVEETLSKCGVAFVLEKNIKGSRASGVTSFVSGEKALILQSGRYATNDHFWFTLFHEIGHLILHSEQSTFIEYELKGSDSLLEQEANIFAGNTLIPLGHQEELVNLKPTYRAILRFAKKIKIAPGVVVGQLQYKGLLPRNYLNKLKCKVEVTL